MTVRVWHKPSTSKKSRKKKQLVASGKAELGEILKRQGGDTKSRACFPTSLIPILCWISPCFLSSRCALLTRLLWSAVDAEIRLTCTSQQKRKASLQNQQTYASILIRVHPPPSISQQVFSASSASDYPHSIKDETHDLLSLPSSDNEDAITHDSTLVDLAETSSGTPASTLRKRRGRRMKPSVKGYLSESDVDPASPSEYSDYEEEDNVPPHDGEEDEKVPLWDDEDIRNFSIRIKHQSPSRSRSRSRSRPRTENIHPPTATPSYPPGFITRSISWIAASALPTRYVSQADNASTVPTESTSDRSTRSAAMSVVDSVTYWRELREAETDADLERTVGMLQNEWYYVGTLVSRLLLPV